MNARRLLSVALASVALGCAAQDYSGPPRLEFDLPAGCEEPSGACLNTGAESFEAGGVRVIHKPLPGHPLVAMQISFDDQVQSGSQLWAETLALTLWGAGGSADLGRLAWPALSSRLGATISASAGEPSDYASISAEAPLPNWQRVWGLLVRALRTPYQDARDLDDLRRAVQRSYASEADDPDAAASADAWSRLLHGELYDLQRESQGVLNDLGTSDLTKAWLALRVRPRWLITIVGDVSQAEVTSAVNQLAQAVPDPPDMQYFDLNPAPPELAIPDVKLLDYPASPSWHIVSYFKGPNAGDHDYAPLAIGLRVLDRRLFSEVRDARGLTYSTGSQLSFLRQSLGRFWLLTDRPLEALPVVQGLVADLKANGPDADELATARAQWRSELLTASATPGGQAALLSDWEMTAGSRQGVDDLLSDLDSVSASEVTDALRTYLAHAKTAAAGSGGGLTEDNLATLFGAP